MHEPMPLSAALIYLFLLGLGVAIAYAIDPRHRK